jgi:membrane fusion protein, multidrug efflux system
MASPSPNAPQSPLEPVTSKRSSWKIPAAISAIVLITVAAGFVLMRSAEGGVNKVALADEPKGVTVVEARATTFRETRRYVGTLEPWLQARVGSQLASGYVDTVLVRPGASVKRGDVLATLDCRNASTANQAVTLQARALEQRQKAAAREATRLGELLDGGFASPNEVEQKQAQSASNEAQIQALLAQAAGKSLEVNDCILRAPFDGEVAARLADPGTFVRPGSSIVAHIVDRSVVRLSADVPEIDFDAIPPKTLARIKVVATGRELAGEIARRAPAADPATRTIHFEIDLANPDRQLPVGTTAEILVDVGQPVQATEVPLLAAKIRGKSATVFVVEEENGSIARKVSVQVLGERGGSVFLKTADQLKPGSHVVTQGRSLLAHNDRVTAKIETAAKGGASVASPPPSTSASNRSSAPPTAKDAPAKAQQQ